MRGSPLVNSLILLVFLVAAGGIFLRVTRTGAEPSISRGEETTIAEKIVRVPYRLSLSAPAREISLDAGNGEALPLSSGVLEIDAENPVVSLKVAWEKDAAKEETRFAKLTLEWPGRPTISHVFDAPGEIDDVFEIPAP